MAASKRTAAAMCFIVVFVSFVSVILAAPIDEPIQRDYVIAGADTELGDFEELFGMTFHSYLETVVGPQFSPPLTFRVTTMKGRRAVDALVDHEVDFAFLDPALAACAMRKGDGSVNAILAFLNRQSGSGKGYTLSQAGSLIFASSKSNIHTIEDIRGRRIMAGKPDQLFSFQAPAGFLARASISIYTDVKQLILATDPAEPFNGVRDGIVDVGFAKSAHFEDLIDKGKLSRLDFRAIDPQTITLSSGVTYPFMTTTDLMSSYPLLAHRSIHWRVQQLVGQALLAIRSNSTAALQGGYTGWQPATSFIASIDTLTKTGLIKPGQTTCEDWTDLSNIVLCPKDYVPRTLEGIRQQCVAEKLKCPAATSNSTFRCLCDPCRLACPETQEQDPTGTCICKSNYISIGSGCVESTALILGVAFPLVMLLIGLIYVYMRWQLRKADLLWRVAPGELKFHDPAICLGSGSFGVVIQAEYRGTLVALKSIVHGNRRSTLRAGSTAKQASTAKSGSSNSRRSGSRGGRSRFFSFLETSYDHIDNIHRRGLLQLKRAFRQANDKLREERANADAEGIDRDVLGLGKGSQAAGRASAAASGRSTSTRSMRFWRTRGQQQRDDLVLEMRVLSKLRHPCVTTIIGAVLTPGCDPVLVMEFMDLGSLYSLLHNETFALDQETSRMMMLDIVRGCRFLHAFRPAVVHGDLKAMNVLVDSRFRAKVADFGISAKQKSRAGTPYWMAPELLKGARISTAGDVYAFGVVLYEMLTRCSPYEGEDFQQVLRDVVGAEKRPAVPPGAPPELVTVMRECWHWDPERRPTFLELERRMCHFDSLQGAQRGMARNNGSNMILDQVFPAHVALALSEGKKLEPEHFSSVTIFFSDIVGFTNISQTLPPEKVCDLLDRLYTRFDILSTKYNIFKVETIGDAYMAVANLHMPQPDQAERVALFSLDAIKAAQATLVDEEDPQQGCINIRVGFHTGSVVANVVGTKNPRYCLFGDTVNTASRMESSSEANKVHISNAAKEELVREHSKLRLESRGIQDIKGKGHMETFWVKGMDTPDGTELSDADQVALHKEVERIRSGRTPRASTASSGDLMHSRMSMLPSMLPKLNEASELTTVSDDCQSSPLAPVQAVVRFKDIGSPPLDALV